ncbi:hypothetical protein GCM10008931_41010 [Oceanobacillus oncorhynchi subsp. oncorhynchi]|uniref:hypothetical protein n=1 Tax=Oceanobacillus oncorhynchi TaxID=545501 RepID=UPI0031D4D2FC
MGKWIKNSDDYMKEMLDFFIDEEFHEYIKKHYLGAILQENENLSNYISTFLVLTEYYNSRIKYWNKPFFSYKRRSIKALKDCELLFYNPYRSNKKLDSIAKENWIELKKEELILNKIIRR